MDKPEDNPTPQGFTVRGQYIKDLSFENPNAPQSLMAGDIKPGIDVGVDLKAHKMQEGVYEMTLHITTRAKSGENILFLVDLSYSGIFQLSNIPEERTEVMLLIDCPFVLFPFARRVIADVTRDGGFPPLLLDPIDFHALYQQNRAKAKNETA